MDDLSEGNDDVRRKWVLVDIEDQPAAHRIRSPARGDGDVEAGRRIVFGGVERGDIDTGDPGQLLEHLLPLRPAIAQLPVAIEELREHLFGVSQQDGVEEVGDRFGVEDHRAPSDDQRVAAAPLRAAQRDASQRQHRQKVGEGHLVLQRETEDIEAMQGRVRLEARQGQPRPLQLGAQIRPGAENALGGHVRTPVQKAVEDPESQMGHPDLVGVRVGEGHRHGDLAVVLHDRVPLPADVADRLLHPLQDFIETTAIVVTA